jgi:hypothetical protein
VEITNKQGQDGLNLDDCRCQSFNNQAAMADIHFAVRKRILDLRPLAVFIPFNSHSLNLVGAHVSDVNMQALTF